MNKKKFLYWIHTIICMLIIFNFSSENSEVSSSTSGNVGRWLLKTFYNGFEKLSSIEQSQIVESIQFYIRKTAHFSIYALLGACTHFGTLANKKISHQKNVFISLLICLVYASSDEIHQLFISGRSGQVSDVLLDFTGSIFGTIIFLIALKIIQMIRLKKSKQ